MNRGILIFTLGTFLMCHVLMGAAAFFMMEHGSMNAHDYPLHFLTPVTLQKIVSAVTLVTFSATIAFITMLLVLIFRASHIARWRGARVIPRQFVFNRNLIPDLGSYLRN